MGGGEHDIYILFSQREVYIYIYHAPPYLAIDFDIVIIIVINIIKSRVS